MAENNSSAPLKTVPMIEAFEAAYSRDWNDPAGNEIKEIWHRAWQEAVAAQAAPADPMDWPLPCDVKVGSGTMCKGVPLRTLVLRMQMLHEWAAPSAGAVPPSMPSLSGDAALAYEQCRAVVHLALAVAEVYSSNALIVARDSRLADQIGAASAEVMEYLGDTLNSTDATTEDDEWLEPIFEGAQERWPAAKPPTLAASDRPQVPGHIGQLIDAYGASRADEDGQSGTRIGELVSALRDWAASLTTPALPATDSSAGDLAEVPDGFGSAEHWKEKAQYWAGVAHELRGQALRGEPVDGIIQPSPQAQPADALDAAARDVLAERRRQVEVEGFTYSHDDSYTDGELAQAAACYAASSQSRDISYMSHLWPWPNHAWKPSTTRNDLLKAGALILAELERINRARAALAAAQEGGKAAKEA